MKIQSFNISIVYICTLLPLTLPQAVLANNDDIEEPVMMALYVDNDLFTGNNKDEDYTGGMAIAFSGEQASSHPFSIDKPLSLINKTSGIPKLLGLSSNNTSQTLHSCEIGLAAFTPKDITNESPIDNDRPYSSLIYISNTQQSVSSDFQNALITSFSIGVLGLSLAGDIQNGIHSIIAS